MGGGGVYGFDMALNIKSTSTYKHEQKRKKVFQHWFPIVTHLSDMLFCELMQQTGNMYVLNTMHFYIPHNPIEQKIR